MHLWILLSPEQPPGRLAILKPAAVAVLISILLALALPAAANDAVSGLRARRYSIDPFRSYLEFSVGFMRIKTERGTFHEYSGTIMHSTEGLRESSVTVVVKAASIFTGVKPRDRHLRSSDFFDVQKYPYIVFRSTGVQPRGENWAITGTLTLHGTTRPVEILFRQDNSREGRLVFHGSLELKRRDFRVVGNFWGNQVLGNRISVELHVEATPVEEGSFRPPQFAPHVLSEALLEDALASDPATLRDAFQELKTQSSGEYDFGPGGLLELAVELARRKQLDAAARALRLNLENFPGHATTLDFLAYLQAIQGHTGKALEIYRGLAQQNPYDPGPQEMLRWLTAEREGPAHSSGERGKRLEAGRRPR